MPGVCPCCMYLNILNDPGSRLDVEVNSTSNAATLAEIMWCFSPQFQKDYSQNNRFAMSWFQKKRLYASQSRDSFFVFSYPFHVMFGNHMK